MNLDRCTILAVDGEAQAAIHTRHVVHTELFSGIGG